MPDLRAWPFFGGEIHRCCRYSGQHAPVVLIHDRMPPAEIFRTGWSLIGYPLVGGVQGLGWAIRAGGRRVPLTQDTPRGFR